MDRVIYNQPLDEISTTRRDPLGALRVHDGVMYKYVHIKNTTATVAGVAGDAVGYDAEDGVANNQVVIDLTDADNPPVPAGLLMGSVTGTLATSYYGWIQVSGPATLNTTPSGAPGDGHPLYLTTTDKTLGKAVEADSAGVYKTVCAVANDASAKTVLCCFPY